MAQALRQSIPDAPASLAVERPKGEQSMPAMIAEMAKVTGVPPMKLMRDFAGLSFGPGKVSFTDYERLRLFDEAFWAGVDRKSVVGQRRNRDLDVQANHRHDWYGLAANKVAANAYLAAYGFPVIPTQAIYAEGLATPSPSLLRGRDELRAFLTQTAAYPIFGKPVEGIQSLGAAAFTGCEGDMLRAADGSDTVLDHFIDDVHDNYASGYMFQPLLRPHLDVAALCGWNLATVRVVTVSTEHGPRVLRACWKIPAGGNVADNYWRGGNLLAQLDMKTGEILRVTRGAGLDLVELEDHPDTGARLIGARVPGWEALKATAIEAARLMRGLGIIGWDIAPATTGPVIVEMNESPDLFLNQLADRRGLLEPDFMDFLARQKRDAADHEACTKAAIAKL